MKTIEINIYEFHELSPEAQKTAHGDYVAKLRERGNYCLDEIHDSLMAIVKAARLNAPEAFFKGKRAFAWLENNLLAKHRVPWKGPERWRLATYGAGYRAGLVKPCPFTGYFADDVFLDHVKKELAKGRTVAEAFESLEKVANDLSEKEIEYQESFEAFKANLDIMARFLEDGSVYEE